jgi:predicted phosphodiesterase
MTNTSALDEDMIETNHYSFNKKTKKYVFKTKEKIGSDIIMYEKKVNTILNLYSDFDGLPHTASEIQHKLNISKEYVSLIVKALGRSHSSAPFTNEQLDSSPIEEMVDEMAVHNETKVLQGFDKKKQRKIEVDAEKWNKFEAGLIDPVKSFLENWVPPVYKVVKKNTTKGKYNLIASLQDIHLGEMTKKEHLFHGKDYNSEIAEKIVNDYCEGIISDVKNKNHSIDTAVLVINGDVLHTCFNGNTAKGTKLHSDLVNEDLFEKGLQILVNFIARFNEEFPKVVVKFLKGNHESVVGSYLGYAIKQYFRQEKTIEVEIVKSWATMFKVGKLAVIATHGGSDELHASLPRNDAQMKTYFQEMMLAKKKEFVDCDHTIVISGHTHSFVNKDMGAFDFYVMGTTVLGDKYADTMNFPRGKPRQNALLVKDDKVVETMHFYFE